MDRRYCPGCRAEKAVLTPEEYSRIRVLWDAAPRRARRHRTLSWEESLKPVVAEYARLSGEADTNWMHIIIHQLWWHPSTRKAGSIDQGALGGAPAA